MSRHRLPAPVIAVALALCILAATATRDGLARTSPPLDVVAVAALPAEARVTLDRIHVGGPFPYSRDGVVFNNREHILPARPRGYYHEYTVPTPGVKTRGARRIVCGGPKREPEACFYTGDHYRTFARIRE